MAELNVAGEAQAILGEELGRLPEKYRARWCCVIWKVTRDEPPGVWVARRRGEEPAGARRTRTIASAVEPARAVAMGRRCSQRFWQTRAPWRRVADYSITTIRTPLSRPAGPRLQVACGGGGD